MFVDSWCFSSLKMFIQTCMHDSCIPFGQFVVLLSSIACQEGVHRVDLICKEKCTPGKEQNLLSNMVTSNYNHTRSAIKETTINLSGYKTGQNDHLWGAEDGQWRNSFIGVVMLKQVISPKLIKECGAQGGVFTWNTSSSFPERFSRVVLK